VGDYDRDELETILRTRAEGIERARRALRREGEGMVASELAHLDNHPADGGSELHEQELDLTTEVFLEEESRRIAEALHALEVGTYGTCVECGAEIPAERLKAVPEAVRCLECQRAFEARHRQANQARA
jgi:phage/conjugal plasmid C-4 type zinc finger TraR family protein